MKLAAYEFGCGGLHALLSGTFGETFISDLEEGRQHWSACEQCRASLPEAENHLKFIEDELLRRVRVNIEQLYHRHCSSEHDLLAKHNGDDLLARSSTRNFLAPPEKCASFPFSMLTLEPRAKSTEPDENTRRLLLLAETGQAVQAQLQVMNDTWGLDYFHLLHTDTEYSSTKCGPLVTSLPPEIQLFVFRSILAMDSVEDCEPATVVEMGSRLYMLVINAATQFNKAFSECHKPAPSGNSEVLNRDRDRLLRVCDKLEHFDDLAESLKAGQMEIIRLWERFGSRASDMEPTLEEHLGLLYARLSESTRRSLQLAEYHYSHNQEPDDSTPAIIFFHRAYEAEFKLRLLAPLETRLQREGMMDYGDERSKLMVGRQLNPSLTLGQVLHYVRSDSTVSKFATDLGLDVTKIYRGSSELNAMRNEAIHGSKHSREAAGRMRSLLLEQPSILAHLFKQASE